MLPGFRRGGVEGVSIWEEAAGEEKPEEGARRCCSCHMRMRLAAEMVAQCTAAWYAPEPFSFMGSPACPSSVRPGSCRSNAAVTASATWAALHLQALAHPPGTAWADMPERMQRNGSNDGTGTTSAWPVPYRPASCSANRAPLLQSGQHIGCETRDPYLSWGQRSRRRAACRARW